ncbi:MAG: threonine synthase, partial [Aureibaculum sp.]
MQYYSLQGKAKDASFKEAVIRGLAEDKGLYFPKTIEKLPKAFIENLHQYSEKDIAFTVIKQFIGDEIPDATLKQIISETLSFDFPFIDIEENIKCLELFHGPTMA